MKTYSRVCKYCGNVFDTPSKHSKVCSECREKNHKAKVMSNLFTETHKVYA